MMPRALTLLFVVISYSSIAQIAVSDNHQYLTENNKPFFWLGDTDWELFHRLNREETEAFLEIRRQQGFNVIQAVALAEFNGIRQPNRYGDWPLNNENPTQLATTPGNDVNNAYEYDYWDHVDFVIDKIAEKGMYVGLLPTWGDKVTLMWGEGPKIFNASNAGAYARQLAFRYKDKKNIIWILGGDRPGVYKQKKDGVDVDVDDREIWKAMATGIEAVLGTSAFITYHPSGGSSSSQYVHNEEWLDMNAFQSGHGSRFAESWQFVVDDMTKNPTKPVLDMEPCYEDHPVNPWDGKWTRAGRGYFTAYDVRARIYRGVFAGGCGVTYGHHQVWQFMNKDLYAPINVGDTIIPWPLAAKAEAANQLQHLKNLMLSRPYGNRVLDQLMIKSDPGKDYTNLVVATRDRDGSYALVYLPQSTPVNINCSKVTGKSKNVWWFDPRKGAAVPAGTVGAGNRTFTPPKGGQDWVLVVDDASKNFGVPGKK